MVPLSQATTEWLCVLFDVEDCAENIPIRWAS